MARRTRARRRPVPTWRISAPDCDSRRLRVFEKATPDDVSGWLRNDRDLVQNETGERVSPWWTDGTRDLPERW